MSDSKRTKPIDKQNDPLSDYLKDIWPQERDQILRPDRLRYLRQLSQSKECVFCEASKATIGMSHLKVFESISSMVVLNKYPYNAGHLMVLPKKHCGEIFNLSDDEWSDLSQLLKLASKVLNEELEPKGLNLGMNHGKVAGAGIPGHLHWHIIPRWEGDTNFFPLICETKVLPQSLEETFKRVSVGFEKHKS